MAELARTPHLTSFGARAPKDSRECGARSSSIRAPRNRAKMVARVSSRYESIFASLSSPANRRNHRRNAYSGAFINDAEACRECAAGHAVILRVPDSLDINQDMKLGRLIALNCG